MPKTLFFLNVSSLPMLANHVKPNFNRNIAQTAPKHAKNWHLLQLSTLSKSTPPPPKVKSWNWDSECLSVLRPVSQTKTVILHWVLPFSCHKRVSNEITNQSWKCLWFVSLKILIWIHLSTKFYCVFKFPKSSSNITTNYLICPTNGLKGIENWFH